MNAYSSITSGNIQVQRTPNFKKQNDQKQDSGLDYGDNEVIFIAVF